MSRWRPQWHTTHARAYGTCVDERNARQHVTFQIIRADGGQGRPEREEDEEGMGRAPRMYGTRHHFSAEGGLCVGMCGWGVDGG